MSGPGTIGELFELMIAGERVARRMYEGLAALFAHHQEACDFWKMYAREEGMHARALESIRDSLDSECLSTLVESHWLTTAREVANFPVEKVLAGINDLDGAYQLANKVENSEFNGIFEFLVEEFAGNTEVRRFLTDQLREHVTRLMDGLPPSFQDAAARKETKAVRES